MDGRRLEDDKFYKTSLDLGGAYEYYSIIRQGQILVPAGVCFSLSLRVVVLCNFLVHAHLCCLMFLSVGILMNEKIIQTRHPSRFGCALSLILLVFGYEPVDFHMSNIITVTGPEIELGSMLSSMDESNSHFTNIHTQEK